MRHVRVAAVDLARRDDAHRRLLREHRAHLHRRGVGAQQHRAARPDGGLVDVEGVLHVARGVVRRDVERLEVVVVELDLRALGDLEAQPREDGA